MQLLDYLPAFLAFTFGVLGVVTKTKDNSKSGIHQITKAGWLFIFLSATSLVFGGYTISAKQVTLEKRAIIADIAREWIVGGISLILKPLCGNDSVYQETEPAAIFANLASEDNISEVGKQRAKKQAWVGGKILSSSSLLPYKTFDEIYQLHDYYVSEGESIVMRTLGSFGTYLSEDEIIPISTLLSDSFLNNDYKLSGKLPYFDMGLEEEKGSGDTSPWNTLGLHYFDAIYEGSSARAGDLEPVSRFLDKAEAAIVVVLGKRIEPLNFAPCSR